ncbi:MAG: AAA family ATPase [Planctomycetota bacterium]|jgi:ABC-type dipeptide/oligopeptide/nickel transport system ATPase subunit
MFKSIKIKNLRAITELEICNLGRVNLFVGQNNCGKTTILEAIFFLVGQTNPKLPINVNIFRGLDFFSNTCWFYFFNNMNIDLDIGIEAILYDTQEEQKLVIHPVIQKQTTAIPVSSDIVSVEIQNGDSKPGFTPMGLELIYTNSQDPSAKAISSIFLKGNELIPEGIKQSSINGVFVGSSTRFDWKVRFGSIQRKKRIDELILLLKEIDPYISDIRLNEVGILEAEVGLSGLIPINLMGGGTASFLSIALAMLDMQDGIVLIDEIETGLHHSVQEKLWKAIFKWAQNLNVQVFATTHSNECIRVFSDSVDKTLFGSESKLFRIERKDEKFRAVEYTQELLSESLESKWEIR